MSSFRHQRGKSGSQTNFLKKKMEMLQASSALFDFSELVHTYSSTLLLCAIASLLLQFIFLRMDPLDKVPGPSFVRWNSLYRPYLNLRGNGPEKLCSLHEKYGSVVRIGPTHVSMSDVAVMNQLYGVGHRFKKVGNVVSTVLLS